ncbi:MAG: DNA repair and recombination protein RadA, partial [Candidatus Lokiarchaeota archaeon]|nr:DNA repair and recombination protein RadA [Candidatus Lokiarchaeota archaeon]
ESGYTSVESISVAPVREIADLTGIGEKVIQKLVSNARNFLEINFRSARNLWKKQQSILRITTGSEKLDELLNGGIETRSITEVFGEYATGKTQLAHQLCATVQLPKERGGIEGGVLFIDAEGTFRPDRIVQIGERFNFDDSVLDQVYYIRAYNSDHQQLIVEKSPKIIKEKNIKLVIVDSIMTHLRAEYIGRGTLSDRQQKLNKLLHKLHQVSDVFNLAVLITNQVMSSPGVVFGDPTVPTGGNIIGHSSTYRLYFRKSKANRRVVRLIDSPCLPEGECLFIITEYGIEDP